VGDLFDGPPPGAGRLATGRPFLDHMVDQLTAHAQLGVRVEVPGCAPMEDGPDVADAAADEAAYRAVGAALGGALGAHLAARREAAGAGAGAGRARFCAPLDEAYSECEIDVSGAGLGPGEAPGPPAGLARFEVAPYGGGCSPGGRGRERIGSFRTALTEPFFEELCAAAGVRCELAKVRGENAHHVVEATFKAFARGLRRAMDDLEGPGPAAERAAAAADAARELAVHRQAARARSTKETTVDVRVALDGRGAGVSDTGLATLDAAFDSLRQASGVSAWVRSTGDLWIDDHHTAEDVSITYGQCLGEALGDKAGVVRMASAEASSGGARVEAVVDLSNRPFLGNDLRFAGELVGDLAAEMVDHVFMSIAFNAGITLHLRALEDGGSDEDTLTAAVLAFGACLRECVAVDPRRAGRVASSKGTLSV